MTDISKHSIGQNDAKKRFQAKRAASEKRFRYLGLGGILLACSFLLFLLATIFVQAVPAFTHHYVKLPIDFSDSENAQALQNSDYNLVYKKAVARLLPFMSGRKDKRIATRLVSGGAGIELQRQIMADPAMLNEAKNAFVPLDDFADLYLKGLVAKTSQPVSHSNLSISRDGDAIIFTGQTIDTATDGNEHVFDYLLKDIKGGIKPQIDKLTNTIQHKKSELLHRQSKAGKTKKDEKIILELAQEIENFSRDLQHFKLRQNDINAVEILDNSTPSILVSIKGGFVKINKLSRDDAHGKIIVPFGFEDLNSIVNIFTISTPQNSRKFSDIQVALVEYLKSRDLIENRFNRIFFTHGASREPEQAGIWGAMVGSLFTMAVTLALAFPLGIATAIYLEEFAPRNKLTYLIEVNINNLAAVPSIIFGLLGLAVFLNWFQLPRSAPLVGGLVLALMTLPTIIIASRAAIRAVPPSIREAAFGIGASKMQVVFHHVLPLAMPGMLTGTIIGMAQALGETAPLLMIGMVAFVVDIPTGFNDPATVMPVQIYMWADFPEPAFQQKTAAAILLLLSFLVLMNALAVFLRKRFERRW